ncbi:cysteine synthase A [Alphaproteobacteria bacterium]|jgi:cysteine synthase|nr:cysteine synthase A [Alphaproteobacteria bacterium]
MAAQSFLDLVGNTPLVKLNAASKLTGCTILGKAEFMNPGGSVKDRAAKAIIEAAEANESLRPGGTIIEGTAGNTGISLALAGNSRGYKTIIVMPETQSQEKKDALRIAKADLKLVPALPYSNPGNYVRVSESMAKQMLEMPNANVVWANQFDNIANKQGHFSTTGPEIWDQTNGSVDGFICAVGSGGTLAGIGAYLKSQNSKIAIGLADPHGSALFNYYEHGEFKAEGNSVSEGIGQGRVTRNLEEFSPDYSFRISDEVALPILFDLMSEEGLYLGGSSAINVAGAIELAKKLGKGHTIVTILCDSGQRYQSKVWNPDFLNSKNLPVPTWM